MRSMLPPCMQATKSTLATIVIIAFDVVNGALAFHSLLGRTHVLQQQHQISQVFDSNGKKYASKDLIPTVMVASQHLRTFQTKKGKMIRIRSPMKLGLGAEAERLLDSLTHHQHIFTTRGTRKTSRTTSRTGTRTHSPVRVHTEPTPAFPVPLNMRELSLNPAILHVEPSHEERNLELVESTLQLLFHCEYHALVEYVECAVPILFGLYLTILCQLPSHKFYPHTQEMVSGQLEGMLKSLSIYVTLEVLSFVVMHVASKQKFKLSALYQLAFVLETHVVQLQSRLFVWIVFILRFTLQHYGVDFSFQFAWVRSRTQ